MEPDVSNVRFRVWCLSALLKRMQSVTEQDYSPTPTGMPKPRESQERLKALTRLASVLSRDRHTVAVVGLESAVLTTEWLIVTNRCVCKSVTLSYLLIPR